MGPTKNKRSAAGRQAEATPVDDAPNVAVVRADGDVDRAGIEACDYMLARASEDTVSGVLDLSRATHIDYRAAPILVARRRVFKARGGELAVAAGRADVRNILRASAGAEIPVFSTVEEAMAYVRGESDMVTTSAAKTTRRPKSEKLPRSI